MSKKAIRAIAALAIILVLYILIVFLIPFVRLGTFWVSFVFTLISFGVAGCAFYIAFFKNPNAKSRFYGFPLARIGAIYGLFQLVAGILFMALGLWIPVWVAGTVSALALAAAALGLIAADAVVDEIETMDVALKKDVALMRNLQSKVSHMAALCENPEVAAAVKALAEEMRFSDPVSNESLEAAEAELSLAVEELRLAVTAGDPAAMQLCRKVSGLLSERNRRCKLGKA